MADFRGKRISTGSPKSGTEVIANRLLQAAGLNSETDVQPQRLELRKTIDAMKDGSIDGFVPKMKEINSVYAEGTVPASAYGTPADVKAIVVPNLLLVRKDFPAENACAITRLMFDKKSDLELIRKWPGTGERDHQLGRVVRGAGTGELPVRLRVRGVRG
jgi:TRAP-type uncharacterized transport system substrate-binding protein